MFAEGTLVMYGSEGVCRIVRVGEAPFPGALPGKCYYTLEPVFSSGVVYAPVDVPVVMRALISREEAERLIDAIPDMAAPETVSRDPKAAEALYKGYLSRYDPESFLALIRCIHAKNEDSRKPYNQTDERYFHRSQALLHGELSVALGIPVEAVEAYIRERVEAAGGGTMNDK